MEIQKVQCKECKEYFNKTDIVATIEGLFCSQDVPDNVNKTFFTVQFSWQGILALLAHLEGNPTVDQLFIVDKIKDKLNQKVWEALKKYVEEVQSGDNGI